MKKLIVLGAVSALAVPGVAQAAPTEADRAEAKTECRTLQRTVDTRANFVEIVKLEARANRRNAFGKCVLVHAQQAEQERTEARSSAVTECRELFPKQGEQRNAFGKCVSERARAKNAEADAEQRSETVNPARACRDEEKADPSKFTAKNAFGQCVSEKARAQQ